MRRSSSVSPRRGQRAAGETPPRCPFRCGPGRVTDMTSASHLVPYARVEAVWTPETVRGVGPDTWSRAAACEPLSLLNIPTPLETLPVTKGQISKLIVLH